VHADLRQEIFFYRPALFGIFEGYDPEGQAGGGGAEEGKKVISGQ